MGVLASNWLLSLFLFMVLISAKDLLFLSTMVGNEVTLSTALGFTSNVVTEAQWLLMTTSDFKAYKAIIIADPNAAGSALNFVILDTTKAIWSPAVTGNVLLLGMCTVNNKRKLLG
jgi:hypothetical protein